MPRALTSLRDHQAVLEIDLDDPAHPAEDQQDPVADRDRATRQAGAGAARDERDTGIGARANDAFHLDGAPWQYRDRRQLSLAALRVGTVGSECGRIGEDMPLAADQTQPSNQLTADLHRGSVPNRSACAMPAARAQPIAIFCVRLY